MNFTVNQLTYWATVKYCFTCQKLKTSTNAQNNSGFEEHKQDHTDDAEDEQESSSTNKKRWCTEDVIQQTVEVHKIPSTGVISLSFLAPFVESKVTDSWAFVCVTEPEWLYEGNDI